MPGEGARADPGGSGYALFRALRPFPEALVAVREALKELFGEREPYEPAVSRHARPEGGP